MGMCRLAMPTPRDARFAACVTPVISKSMVSSSRRSSTAVQYPVGWSPVKLHPVNLRRIGGFHANNYLRPDSRREGSNRLTTSTSLAVRC